MRKMIIMLAILPTLIYAAYNPFFGDTQPKVEVVKAPPPPPPARTNINILYFGFVDSSKGKFALVKFDGKDIIVRKDDPLYLGEAIYKVKKISSNYILFTDRYNRVQTVYFSSAEGSQQ